MDPCRPFKDPVANSVYGLIYRRQQRGRDHPSGSSQALKNRDAHLRPDASRRGVIALHPDTHRTALSACTGPRGRLTRCPRLLLLGKRQWQAAAAASTALYVSAPAPTLPAQTPMLPAAAMLVRFERPRRLQTAQ